MLSSITLVLLLSMNTAAHDSELRYADVLEAFPQYQRITPLTYRVDAGMAAACTTDRPSHEARYGPHAGVLVAVYMNPLAAEAFDKGSIFPTGAVVVKQKLDDSNSPVAVGGMIKRSRGWDYFYAPQGKPPSADRTQACSACHARATATDHVFTRVPR